MLCARSSRYRCSSLPQLLSPLIRPLNDPSHQWRAYSSILATPSPPHTVSVPVGSNGSINLDIYPPPRPSPSTPVIIHLPRGPLALSAPPPTNLSPLALAANATVVQLHYRLGKGHRYPGPIHDVLAGYDWVVQHLVKAESTTDSRSSEGRGRVAVCGELLGGSLAAMLALTECRAHDPHGVCSAVLGNPIADWTAMYPVTTSDPDASGPSTGGGKTKKKPGPKDSWVSATTSAPLPTRELLKARGTLFRTAADYFDPFASPLLFFRTPSTEIPGEVDPLDELFAELDGVVRAVEKKRKSYRRYPSSGLALRLPDTRVWVGGECALRDMGVELGRAMEKAGKEASKEWEGGGRVSVEGMKGVGLWSGGELLEMGSWFGHMLWSREGA